MKRIVVGMSGASGAIYGIRMLEVLKSIEGIETHLVMSPNARLNIEIETSHTFSEVESLADVVHAYRNQAASLSSGSFKTEGVVVAPCSMKSLSSIVHSFADNLLVRAADVSLKEKRKLVLVVRETPLHQGHLALMSRAADLGAHILPPVPSFYHRPKSIQDIIDQTIGKIFDYMGIRHDLFQRWGEDADRGQRIHPLPSVVAGRLVKA